MNAKVKKVSQGFTIIEVLIVLAIAALILAVVFFAVPQLQRSQRDNQRQSIATRLKTELDSYAGNNQGSYPFASVTGSFQNCTSVRTIPFGCNDWYSRYVNDGTANPPVNTKDPSTGNNVTVNIAKQASLPSGGGGSPGSGVTVGNVYIDVGDTCAGDNVQTSTSTNAYAIVIALERKGTLYCVGNG